MSETLSIASEPAATRGARPAPHLFLVLQAHRPLATGLRVCLDGVARTEIGRGDGTAASRTAGDLSGCELRVDDPWMSSAHARVVAALDRFTIDDLGSKNGTVVNGQKLVGSRVLADGDWIEIGRTFFRFRAELPAEGAELAAGRPAGEGDGLATWLPELARSFAMLTRVAGSSTSVVITGATGTGKEVIARALHRMSGRLGAFVAVNCGALPEALVETEVFGHRRGAFSGAVADRPGLVRSADRGTLFLDEVGELPAPAQVALLRVLQEREVVPVGASAPVAVDLRVAAATHRDLEGMVAAGTLREDFYHRISGFRLALPALADRREDLGLLIAALIARLAGDPPAVSFEPRAARSLLTYAWPGNVRELERTLGTALALSDGAIGLEHLPAALTAGPPAKRAAEVPSDDDARRDRIAALLAAHHGNVSAVARELGKAPAQIRRWMQRYRLDAGRFRR